MVPEKKRYAAIDALRIIAAAAVVFFHYAYLMRDRAAPAPALMQSIACYGYLGVELFFMISGFVIALSALGRSKPRFAYARFVRLWPAFMICMGLTVLAAGWPGTGVVLANSTMLPHVLGAPYIDGVYWTLMFEIIFYAGISSLLATDDKFFRRLRAFTVVWLVAATIGQFVPLPNVKVLLVLDYAPFFSCGISLFLLERTGRSIANMGLLAASIAMAMILAAVQSREIGDAHWPAHPIAWVCAVIVLLSAAGLYLATQIDLGKRGDRIAFALGGVSYPLYLLHYVFGSALAAQFGEMTGLLGMLATSYAVWRVELPIRNWLLGRSNLRPAFARKSIR
jgi:peptidoglycan/LPS O-acetylase OafA/YrhL